ncbi:pectin methylesterase 2 [Actinidia rufa]|uniref:Pectinesterase n=1 Tax=Actinidia rufa TaxID=165716 RepID=A0A7J0DSU6_9ERIC|nr:pectin methylesterase 2 [Actinidia rufa]
MFGFGHSAASISPCSQTPYPRLCNSLVLTKPLAATDQTQLDLRESALKVTLNEAHQAHGLIMAMDVSSFNERAKVAWADCLELYEDTINQINRSLGSTDPASSQTWLSAANTNQQTCKNGFMDFNLAFYLKSFPVILSDFSKLLSNSLAINKVVAPLMASLSTKKTRGRRLLSDGFPEWISSADRKLLQTAPKGDVVVAQDGSGNYETISAAVAAAKGRSGGNRFVIHVKAGVYKENVEISRTMKNLMVIGDGIGSTIVTGSKNAEDGATTYGSATFGTGGRVKWPGYHVITSVAEAGKFSVGNFLAGDSWIPSTGVPFTSGL